MNNMKDAVKKLTKIKNKIAEDRDELRAMLDEYQDVLDTADTAVRDLESTIDILSQYV